MNIPARDDQSEWELGGITDTNGHLDRPVVANEYLAPEKIWLDGDALAFNDRLSAVKNPKKGILDHFVKLHNKEPEVIATFVQEWGPLKIADSVNRFLQRAYGQTFTPEQQAEFMESFFECELPDGLGAPGREPISVYRAVAAKLRNTLRSAAEIYSGLVSEEDWLARYPYDCESCAFGLDAALARVELSVFRLLKISDVSFTPEWSGDRWQIKINYFGLFGALAVQVLMAVTKSDSLYTCAGCGEPYIRSAVIRDQNGRIRVRRRPKPGQNNYCGECGTAKRAVRAAKIRYGQKIREAKRMFKAGTPVTRIADRLEADIDSVQRWIGTIKANAKTKTKKTSAMSAGGQSA